ncbi:High mobility group protein C [Frankliniella fusca]|uniref:High mobility group protein C n=1 Tax=Frankliniella fusca TaxID=407009 RepID=A0AAE1HXC0_9NEOP|nr:High mobility group protein C [Frankliniella fusca]
MTKSNSRNPFINYYLKVARRMRGKPVTVIAKVAARRWRAMSQTKRLQYYRACGTGYNWGASLPSSRRRCDSGLHGRPPAVSRSPFINFFVHMYKQMGRDMPVTKVARMAARKWRCMSVPERRTYFEAACRFGGGRRRRR